MTVVDCHAHFEPRMLEVEPMLRKLDEAGVDRVVLVPALNDPLHDTPERLLAWMRKLMNSRARPLAELVHRATLTRHGDLKLRGEVFRIYKRPDNESVAQVLEARPDRFWGWIFLNPAVDGPAGVVETLERWRHVPGFVGVKLHPHWHDYRTALLTPLLARCEELRLPVLIHLGFGKRGDFVSLCRAFPKLRLISAHAGFPFYKDLWRHRSDCPNLFVDLSSPYIDEALARAAVEAMGPERCLYGTDAPYGDHDADGLFDYAAIRGWVERMPVPDTAIDGMLGRSFLELVDPVAR